MNYLDTWKYVINTWLKLKPSLLQLFICSLFILPVPSHAEGTYFGYATVTTDHRAYGVSLTQTDPAVQVLAGYDVGNGFYLGTFISTFNFIDDDSPYEAGENLETDVYLGYRHIFNKDIYLSVTLYQYLIQGTNKGIELDFTELMFDLHSPYGKLTFSHTLNDILGDLSVDNAYRIEYNKSQALWESGLSLDMQLGWWDTKDALGDDYIYYNLGLSYPLGPVTACVTYNGTDNAGQDLFGHIADPTFFAKATWAF
ncbi:TorF family putative porin [Shewanella eurypsychrophilus]|uniref:TorF family putative porin n=1 Tax=Shewanella eurypsychrophilus TaxID=2593656 RepID=A0ABX6VC05_9GAMM|nr:MULTISPECIES: TorF family putative porin [Shewanella]QFU23852.1 hypothetical protein FS418_19720 [Shewanella sp. YLB-09]QPG59074.1 TorF family putative porin [Shewanella eurypsychrophilus]